MLTPAKSISRWIYKDKSKMTNLGKEYYKTFPTNKAEYIYSVVELYHGVYGVQKCMRIICDSNKTEIFVLQHTEVVRYAIQIKGPSVRLK